MMRDPNVLSSCTCTTMAWMTPILLGSFILPKTCAFVSIPVPTVPKLSHTFSRSASPPLMELAMVVDPLLNLAVAATTATTTTIASMDLLPPLVELGVVAVISAAVGVMSQVPRIHALEQELSVAKRALAASQVDTQDKLNVLEEKLFVMDQEFEEQTVRFQRQYDRTQREQMEAFKDKLRRDTAFQVEIQMAQSKSAQLMSQASEENSRTFKQEELSQLKLKQQQLNDANAQLEQALQTADQELDALRTAAASKKKFLLW